MLEFKINQILDDSKFWKKILIGLSILFFLEKELLTFIYFPRGVPLSQLSFGFGGYISTIMSRGEYFSCIENICNSSSRMPIIPLFLSALGLIVDDQLIVAMFKNFIFSIFLYFSLVALIKNAKRTRFQIIKTSICILIVMVLSLPVIKHFSMITYEEGFIGELLVIYTISYLAVICSISDLPSAEEIHWYATVNLLLATVIYLTKSSMILILILSILIGIYIIIAPGASIQYKFKTYCAIFISLFSIFLWVQHNKNYTGQSILSTTYDGENLYRGWNSFSLKIYPEISLDRMFDSNLIVDRSGVKYEVPQIPSRNDFANEVQWNTYYKQISILWIQKNPIQSTILFFTKINNFFLSIVKTPFTSTADAQSIKLKSHESYENSLFTLWLLFGRSMQFLLLKQCYEIYRKNTGNVSIVYGVFLLLAAYSIPYIIGFNYERHITPFLILVICCYVFIKPVRIN